MARLFIRYGAMGSSKTANALMVAYNYEERGKRPLLAKPALDNRDGSGVMASRIGISRPCISVERLVEMGLEELANYDCVIVDEAQFCTKEQIGFLSDIVDVCDVPVIAYGLRTDFSEISFRAPSGCSHGQTSLRKSRPCAGADARQPALPDSTRTEPW